MDKQKKLIELFSQMREVYPPYKDDFKSDGINDVGLYNAQKEVGKAVLFIAKEPNDKNKGQWDFPSWWKNNPLYKSFSIRLAEWAYGLINKFPEYDHIPGGEEKKRGLLSSAFMNLKKSGGGGMADNDKIEHALSSTQELLHKEVEIIDPDIIIGCGIWYKHWQALFGDIKWIKSGYDIYIAKRNNVKLVAFKHPSNRFPAVMNYVLLEKVINSKAFKEL